MCVFPYCPKSFRNAIYPSSILYLCISSQAPSLVVEQTDVLLDKGDAQLLGCLEHGAVVLAAAGGSNVPDS